MCICSCSKTQFSGVKCDDKRKKKFTMRKILEGVGDYEDLVKLNLNYGDKVLLKLI